MSSNVGGANVRLGADASGFVSGLSDARKQLSLFTREINTNVAQAYKKADAEQKAFRGGLTRLGDEFVSLGKKMAIVGALPVLFAAGQAYKDYADIQRMEKGLALYGETLDDVRRLAKEPNIGVFDGAKSLVGLRAVKIESQLAERAVKSFANAIAASGGNAADLEPALLNLKQFKGTRNINQVDLRQLGGRIPQTMDVLQKAFGTTDTEKLNKLGIDKFIEGFVTELEKIPKVAGGAGVAMEQVSDSFTFFSGTIGEGIERSFNVSEKLKSVGEVLDDLATNFRSLNPEAQKSILWIGGMAVAVPILTTAIGGLIKLIPLIAAGFGPISWPIVAILATSAAVSGLAALLPLLSNKTAEYNKQQELVAGFSSKLNPLIAKYEELKKKASLTSDEQKILKDVTKQISDLVPTAVSGWDKYGNAIDINVKKVRGYTQDQNKLLLAMQATRREALLLDNRKSDTRKNELSKLLNSGKTTEFIGDDSGGLLQTRNIRADEIRSFSKELAALHDQDVKNRKELLSIGGVDTYNKEVTELKKLLADRAKIKEDYAKALKSGDQRLIHTINDEAIALDKIIAVRSKKASSLGGDLRKGLGERVKAVVKPDESVKDIPKVPTVKDSFGLEHKRYLDLLREEKKELLDIRDIAADIKSQNKSGATIGDTLTGGLTKAKDRLDNTGSRRMGVSLDDINRQTSERPENIQFGAALDLKSFFKGKFNIEELREYFAQIPKLVEESVEDYQNKINGFADATAKLGSYFQGNIGLDEMRKYFQEIPKIAGESGADYQNEVDKNVDATIQLNQELTSAIRSAAVEVGVGFGEMIGNLANGAGGLEGFGKRVMGTISSLLKDMGKSLIAFGTSGIVLKNLGKNPYAAVAAGIAMVALGQVAQNTLNKKSEAASVRLAKGGLAYGETTAIVGDNKNAKYDPEVIAPLSKLKGILGENRNSSGQSVFIPEMKLRGEDIYIQFKRVDQRNKALGIS